MYFLKEIAGLTQSNNLEIKKVLPSLQFFCYFYKA